MGASHESEPSGKAGASGSEAFTGETRAGAGGQAALPAFGCQFSGGLIEESLWGQPYDRERGCIDTSSFVAPGWCIVPPGEGSGLVGFQCLRRQLDGAEFWTYAPGELAFDSEHWEPCQDLFPDAPLPKPCFAAGCESAPRSVCDLVDTKEKFKCGDPDSEYDENCCTRQDCSASRECPDGQECAVTTSVGQRDCWDTLFGCQCAGDDGSPSRMQCVSVSSK